MRTVSIRGKKWRWKTAKDLPEDVDGVASPEPHNTIRIRDGLKGQYLLEVCIHEALHAACWDLSEEAVTESAKDIAGILWKLGWRLPEKAASV